MTISQAMDDLNEAMAKMHAAQEAVLAHFGAPDLGHLIRDYRDFPWRNRGEGEIWYWEDICDDDSQYYDDAQYSGNLSREGSWRTDDYSLFTVRDCWGEVSLWLFANDKEIK